MVIFGAGPAGLAAAIGAREAGLDTTLLEMGKYAKDRARHGATDLVTGVGGAGLYSDGKFSFFPAATQLWQLPNRGMLQNSYDWLHQILGSHLTTPAFPSSSQTSRAAFVSYDGIKSYPAQHMDFPSRLALIERLTDALSSNLEPNSSVEEISTLPEGSLSVEYRSENKLKRLRTEAVVLAGGRFGGLILGKQAPWLPLNFRRYEVGIRIESTADSFFLQNHKNLDPKYIVHDTDYPNVEWRTFCTCRNGEIVETEFLGLTSYSGRSDVTTTHFSNVGFNVRITKEPRRGSPLSEELINAVHGKLPAFRFGLREYLSGGAIGFGTEIDLLLRRGLQQLPLEHESDFVVTGPCIEGIGYYPTIDENLKVPGAPIWVAGDQTGVFRGLTAAFLSGHYAAGQIDKALKSPS